MKIALIKKYVTRRYINYVVVAFAYVLVSYLNWTLLASAFFVLFIWFLLNPIKTADAFKIAVASLLVAPLLLLVKRKTNAEYLALVSFFFLVLALISELRSRSASNRAKG